MYSVSQLASKELMAPLGQNICQKRRQRLKAICTNRTGIYRDISAHTNLPHSAEQWKPAFLRAQSPCQDLYLSIDGAKRGKGLHTMQSQENLGCGHLVARRVSLWTEKLHLAESPAAADTSEASKTTPCHQQQKTVTNNKKESRPRLHQ